MGLRNRKTNRSREISQTRPIQRTLIDACCLIDLLASGEMEAILRASGHAWYLPDAVRTEVQFVRQDDPAQPGAFLNVPVDLTPHIGSGLLSLCQPDNVPGAGAVRPLCHAVSLRWRSDVPGSR